MEDYRAYLQTGDWGDRRAACLKAAGYRCVVCNRWNGLQAHHRTYERVGFELPGDLTCLCRDCHEAYHKQWPELRPEPEPGPESQRDGGEGAKLTWWDVLGAILCGLATLAGIIIWWGSR